MWFGSQQPFVGRIIASQHKEQLIVTIARKITPALWSQLHCGPQKNTRKEHCTNTAISRKVVGKNVHTTIPKGNMGYDRYTVPDDCSCRTYFCCFPLALANTFLWPFVPILLNFSEEQWTKNHSQCLTGLSRALFLTNFLKIAVYNNFDLTFGQ